MPPVTFAAGAGQNRRIGARMLAGEIPSIVVGVGARGSESYAPFSIASSSGSVGEINSVGKVKARLSKLRPHIAAIAATMITFDRSNADLDAHCSGSVTAT